MIEVMFDVPSDEQIEKVIITEDTVKHKSLPEIIKLPDGETRPALKAKKTKKRKGIESA